MPLNRRGLRCRRRASLSSFVETSQALFRIRDLVRQEGSAAYALYATTANANGGERCRVATFNTNGEWTYRGTNFLCDHFNTAWLTDFVVIDVWLEFDDGVDSPTLEPGPEPTHTLHVFRGTSDGFH